MTNFRTLLDDVQSMIDARKETVLKEAIGLNSMSFEQLKETLYNARLQQHNLKEGSAEKIANDEAIERTIEMIEWRQLEEKKLTPAELKKREEVATAIEKDNPDMPMDKKMAIATSVAKKVEEAVVPGSVKKDKDGNILSATTVPDKHHGKDNAPKHASGDTVTVNGGGLSATGKVEKADKDTIHFRHPENNKLYRVPHRYVTKS